MIRLLFSLLLLTVLGIGAAWLAQHPGSLTLRWLDYQVDTSVAFFGGVLVVSALALAALFLLLRALLTAPRTLFGRRRLSHYRRGLSEITASVAALAAGDAGTAGVHTRKAEKLLGTTPLTLLLSAQIARSRGDDGKTRLLLEQMLEYKETEYLAARSLSEAAGKQKLLPKALLFAQRAASVNPKEKAAVVAMISLHVRLQQWQEAQQAIARSTRKFHLPRSEARRFRGLVQLKYAQALLLSDPAAALYYAQKAAKSLPGFVPAAVFSAQAALANGQNGKAIGIIFQAWKQSPHPELAEALRSAIATEPKEKQLKLVQKLAALKPQDAQSQMALAQTALAQQNWAIARKAAKAALAREETAQACRLMAEIEQQEYADYDASGRWLAKSAQALPDPHWQCHHCSQISKLWDTHCPACDAFDTLEWRRQELRYAQ